MNNHSVSIISVQNLKVVCCVVKVIRRPYMFVYRSEKDHQELDVINVASALIEFSEETTSMIRVISYLFCFPIFPLLLMSSNEIVLLFG